MVPGACVVVWVGNGDLYAGGRNTLCVRSVGRQWGNLFSLAEAPCVCVWILGMVELVAIDQSSCVCMGSVPAKLHESEVQAPLTHQG